MADFRMPDFNKVFLTGNLTRDPELKYLPSGMAVCKLGLAVTHRYKTKEGEQREDTLFINIDTWSKSAEYCGQNLKKGMPILVEGTLRSDEWEDKASGQKRTAIKVTSERIQRLSWDDRGAGGASGGGPGGGGKPQPRAIEEPIPEDDIPF
ncbi:MAG: single-stranded DNA-binding protein [Candidatus Hydrogenedentota bacterium]